MDDDVPAASTPDDDRAERTAPVAPLQRDRQDLLRPHARLATLRAELDAAVVASVDQPVSLALDHPAAHGPVTLLGHPLRGADRLLGVLGLVSPEPLPDHLSAALRDGAEIVAQGLDRGRVEAEVRITRDRLATVLATVSDGVTAHRPDGELVFANAAAARLCGLESVEQMLKLPGREILRLFELRDEAGDAVSLDHLPFVRARLTGRPAEALLHRRQLATGELSWTRISSTPVAAPDGDLIVTVYTDLTRQKRSEDAWRFVAEASAAVGGSLALESTLPRVATLAVPRVADQCLIHRALAGGNSELVATAGVSSGAQGADVLPAVLAGGPAVTSETLLVVPVMAGARVFGALTFAQTESRRRFGAAEQVLAAEVARRIGLAVETAGAYRTVREAVRTRDNFLAVASHELRTPLASLTLLVSSLGRLARQGRLPELPVERLIDRLLRVEEQADRLNELIGQLLDVSRLASGRVSLSLGPTDLHEVSARVVSRLADEATRAGAAVSLESEGPLVGVWDVSRIDQIITNLVTNALQYGKGSPVALSLASDGESARLSVRDGGPGIAIEDQSRIFEQYERGPAGHGPMGGLGLGLWIVRQLVDAHRGRLALESGPDRGSCFTVWLPRRRVPQ